MRKIPHWNGTGSVEIAESKGGVLATACPLANLIQADIRPWPAPELIQKFYASERWHGKTPEDDRIAREYFGHYCDLQSLNSEDAITWSFFGPLIYGPAKWREEFASNLFSIFKFPAPRSVAMWLWRRIPHPEKPASTGGPEIDFGIHTDSCAVLGEAKWNSQLGAGQGVARNRTQLDLRVAYCAGLGLKALPTIKHWGVLGIGRSDDVLNSKLSQGTAILNLSCARLIPLFPSQLKTELSAYLNWKEEYSSKAPTHRKRLTI